MQSLEFSLEAEILQLGSSQKIKWSLAPLYLKDYGKKATFFELYHIHVKKQAT